jgi:hypothetical protein
MSGLKWLKMASSGARDKYINILIKLNLKKKSKQINSNQNKSQLSKLKENKIKRNKFGFPTIN